MRASLSLSTMVPRALRTNLAVRLIMPCRLPWARALTLPPPVILKRFLAPLLVFSLGILLSYRRATPLQKSRRRHGFLKHKKPPRQAPRGDCRLLSYGDRRRGATTFRGRGAATAARRRREARI